MAVRVSTDVDEAYTQFRNQVRLVKNELIGSDGTSGIYVRLQTVNVNWQELTRLQGLLHNAITALDTIAAIPGIVQYVKNLENDQTYDVGAEYQSLRSALVSLRDGIFNGLPKSGSFLLVQTLAQSGDLTDRTFTPAQTASFRSLIDSVRPTLA